MPLLNQIILYGASLAAVLSTGFVVFSSNPVYAVLYLVLSLFSVSLIFWTLGAAFLAVLEILVYAGAIMVLFLFVVMMLNLGTDALDADTRRPGRKQLLLPGGFALFLAVLTIIAIVAPVEGAYPGLTVISYKEIGQALFTRHYLGVELVSLILTVGIVGGMHLGRAASAAETDSPAPSREKNPEAPVQETV